MNIAFMIYIITVLISFLIAIHYDRKQCFNMDSFEASILYIATITGPAYILVILTSKAIDVVKSIKVFKELSTIHVDDLLSKFWKFLIKERRIKLPQMKRKSVFPKFDLDKHKLGNYHMKILTLEVLKVMGVEMAYQEELRIINSKNNIEVYELAWHPCGESICAILFLKNKLGE